MFGGCFDIKTKVSEIKLLEKSTFIDGFWDTHGNAQQVMQKLNNLKSEVEVFLNLEIEIANSHELYLMALSEDDQSLVNESIETLIKLKSELDNLALKAKLDGKFDKNNAILTLHSGAGGTEACDWVDMLFRMFLRWAEKRNYKVEIMDLLPGDEAGIKSIVFMIKGLYSYGYLQSEIGVHRLVRISPFDTNKRRHTSFASCDVIPAIADDIDIKIEEKDLRVDTYRASGAGGQHVNTTDSAVRITHLPTNAVVQCQTERSQYKNKASAMKLLKAKLYALEEEKQRSASEKHYDEKGSIGWGNQIRSYVFCPYTMVKDHRTGCEVGNVQSVMDGGLDPFIQAYLNT
ncbi:MAG: peptide chain release factor 2 [bacterium]|nr:peptide chain release factor 2 [bacterium]